MSVNYRNNYSIKKFSKKMHKSILSLKKTSKKIIDVFSNLSIGILNPICSD